MNQIVFILYLIILFSFAQIINFELILIVLPILFFKTALGFKVKRLFFYISLLLLGTLINIELIIDLYNYFFNTRYFFELKPNRLQIISAVLLTFTLNVPKKIHWNQLLFPLLIAFTFSPFLYKGLEPLKKASSINFFQGLYVLFLLYGLYRIILFYLKESPFHKCNFRLGTGILRLNLSLLLFAVHPLELNILIFLKLILIGGIFIQEKIKANWYKEVLMFLIFLVLFLDSNEIINLTASAFNIIKVWSHANEYFILHALHFSPIIILWVIASLQIIKLYQKKANIRLILWVVLLFFSDQSGALNSSHKYLVKRLRSLIPFEEIIQFKAEENSLNIPERNEFNSLKKKINYQFIRSHFPKNNDFGVHFKSNCFKVQKYGQNFSKVDTNYALHLIPNEYESFQTIISVFCDSVKIDSVWIENPNVWNPEIFIQDFIYCKNPAYQPELKGWIPDPLIPIKYGIKNKIYNQENSSIWITIKPDSIVNKNELSVYLSIKVYKNGKSSNKLVKKTININWYNVSLKSFSNFKTLIGYNPFWKRRWFGDSVKNKHSDLVFYEKYGFSPISFYSRDAISPNVEERKELIRKNRLHSLGFFNPKLNEVDSVIEVMDSVRKWATDNEILENAFWYCYDEIDTPSIKALRLLNKKRNDDIPILTCGNEYTIDTTLENIFWVVLPLNESLMNKKNHFGYICNVTSPPSFNFFIDQHAIKSSLALIRAFTIGQQGFLYYDVANWGTNCLPNVLSRHGFSNDETYLKMKLENGITWPNVHWNSFTYMNYNGDGVLVYPGRNFELLPSIRLINIREGIKIIRLIENLDKKSQDLYIEKYNVLLSKMKKISLQEEHINSFIKLKLNLYKLNSKP